MKPNLVVDTRGLFCPLPVIKTSEAIQSLATGGVVHVISDDPAVEFDMPAWCKSQGHTIERATTSGGEFHFFVKRRK